MPAITKSFSFDPDLCPDVVRWFDGIPRYKGALSEAMIRAIRADIAGQGTGKQGKVSQGTGTVSLDEVMIKLTRIEALLGQRPAEQERDELPADVLLTLDGLAGLEG